MVSNYNYPNYAPVPQMFDRIQPFGANMQSSSIQSGPAQRFLKGRPVTCFEEAQGITIDFDGSLHVFPDIANKRIYTKQLLNDGSCPLKCYVEQPIPVNTSSQVNEQPVSNKIIQELQNKVEMLEQQLKELKHEPKSNAIVPNVRTA